MRLTATIEPAWYPVDGIRFRPGVPVVVSLHRPAFEILAVIEQDDRRRWWWFQCGVYGGPAHGWIENAREKLEMVGRNPPSDFSPRLFRPVDLARWDHKRTPLPAPVTPALGSSLQTARANPTVEPLDPHAGDDGWCLTRPDRDRVFDFVLDHMGQISEANGVGALLNEFHDLGAQLDLKKFETDLHGIAGALNVRAWNDAGLKVWLGQVFDEAKAIAAKHGTPVTDRLIEKVAMTMVGRTSTART